MSLSFQTMAAIRFGYGFRPGEAPPQNKDQLDAISRLSICRSGPGAAPERQRR
jgi:hypothetical protein